MTRSKLREHCFKMLFCADFYPAEEKEEQIERYFDSFRPCSTLIPRNFRLFSTSASHCSLCGGSMRGRRILCWGGVMSDE